MTVLLLPCLYAAHTTYLPPFDVSVSGDDTLRVMISRLRRDYSRPALLTYPGIRIFYIGGAFTPLLQIQVPHTPPASVPSGHMDMIAD